MTNRRLCRKGSSSSRGRARLDQGQPAPPCDTFTYTAPQLRHGGCEGADDWGGDSAFRGLGSTGPPGATHSGPTCASAVSTPTVTRLLIGVTIVTEVNVAIYDARSEPPVTVSQPGVSRVGRAQRCEPHGGSGRQHDPWPGVMELADGQIVQTSAVTGHCNERHWFVRA